MQLVYHLSTLFCWMFVQFLSIPFNGSLARDTDYQTSFIIIFFLDMCRHFGTYAAPSAPPVYKIDLKNVCSTSSNVLCVLQNLRAYAFWFQCTQMCPHIIKKTYTRDYLTESQLCTLLLAPAKLLLWYVWHFYAYTLHNCTDIIQASNFTRLIYSSV